MYDFEHLIKNLTEEQKDRILGDLFVCLTHGRLLDSSTGWQRTVNNDGVQPIPMPYVNDEAHAPSWESLRACTFPYYVVEDHQS